MENKEDIDFLKEEMGAIRKELSSLNEKMWSLFLLILITAIFVIAAAGNASDPLIIIVLRLGVLLMFVVQLIYLLIKMPSKNKNKNKS